VAAAAAVLLGALAAVGCATVRGDGEARVATAPAAPLDAHDERPADVDTVRPRTVAARPALGDGADPRWVGVAADEPRGLAVGDDGTVWFWGAGGVVLTAYDPGDGSSRAWPLGRALEGTGWDTPMAVGRDGAVWLGAGPSLVRFSPGDGSVERLEPPVPAGAAMRAIAVAPDGRVAVAVAASRSVLVLDAQGGLLHDVQLPGGEPTDVTFGADGELVIGVLNEQTHTADTVVRWRGPDDLTEVAAPSWFVEQAEPGLVVGFGSIALLTPGGSLVELDGLEANARTTPVAGGGGLVVPAAGELKVIGWEDGQPARVVDAFSLGTFTCGGARDGGFPPSGGPDASGGVPRPTAPVGSCPVLAQRVAASASTVAVATTSGVWAIRLGG